MQAFFRGCLFRGPSSWRWHSGGLDIRYRATIGWWDSGGHGYVTRLRGCRFGTTLDADLHIAALEFELGDVLLFQEFD